MKFHFSMVMKGNPTMEAKFFNTIKDNPELHMDLIRSLGNSVMLAFRFGKEDEIIIESFKAGKIPEEEVAASPIQEVKEVAN